MKFKQQFQIGALFLFVTGLFLFSVHLVHATAIATSNIDFQNLLITPAAGVVQLLGDWTVEAFARAKNNLGEDVVVFNQVAGGAVAVNAAVTSFSGNSFPR